MLFLLLVCIASLQIVFGQSNPPAPVITNNLPGSGYTVTIDTGPGNIMGSFYFITTTDQRGVQVSASLNGFNVTDENTYTYHIHQYPVPLNGSCIDTGVHLDPYHAGASFICDPADQSLCQVGDLSGKHGDLAFNGTAGTGSYSFTYFDNFLSTNMSNPAFFGNLSVVIHRKRDSFRLKCGNMVLLGSSAGNASAFTGIVNTTNSSTTYNSPTTSVLTSVVTTTTVFPTDLRSYPTSTTTTIAFETPSAAHSTVSTTSSFASTPTGIQQSSGAPFVSVRSYMIMFKVILVIAAAFFWA